MQLTIDPPDDGLAAHLAVTWVGIALSEVKCACGWKHHCRTDDRTRTPVLDGHNLDAVRTHAVLCPKMHEAKASLDNPRDAV